MEARLRFWFPYTPWRLSEGPRSLNLGSGSLVGMRGVGGGSQMKLSKFFFDAYDIEENLPETRK